MRSGKGTFLHTVKNHFVAALGEFVGTFLFLFFAFAGTQTANQPSESTITGVNPAQLLYISLVFGFSLAINVWIFFRVSGGLFNPAVTLALCICRVVPPVRSIFIFVAQILGGIAAAGLVKGLIPGGTLYNVVLRPEISIAQGLFLEMFLTAELVFTILMLAAEKQKSTFIAPVGIGLALFVAELVGVYWTGGALNPARAFGPAVVQRSFPGYHWLYWLGPVLGALLASGFYGLLKVLKYEEVNGDQDKSEEEVKSDESKVENKKSNRNAPNSDQRRSSSHRDQDYDEQDDSRYEYKSSNANNNAANRGANRKPKNLSNAPIHNQRWSRELHGGDEEKNAQNAHEMYALPNHDTNRPPQTYYNHNHGHSYDTSSRNSSEREQRSRAFAPEPPPIQYASNNQEYEGNYEYRPTNPMTGKPYLQDTDAATRSNIRRVSLSRRERELGYRTDNVDEVGGHASHDIHRAGSGRRGKQY